MRDLPEGWVEKNLVSCLEKVIDYRGKTPKKSDSGILTLSAKSVKMGKIDYSQAYYISKETYDKFMVRGFPKKGDILMTTEAPLGCIAKLDRDDVSVAQRLLTLRGKEGILDNDYLMFYLTSRRGQHELQSRASGSTVQGIKRSEFEHVQIVLPPLPEQKAIADMLSSFDEKIELLREQNKTLETLAQTIFKEWFVHFNFPDPHGKPYRNNGGAMVESELGLIPQGWRVGGIRCLVEHVKKNIKPFAYPERAYQHYSLPAFDSGKRPEKHNGSEISSNKYAVVENCYLVSKLNPSTPRIWAILNPLENSVCSTEFQVIKPKIYDSFGFVYGALTSYGLRRELSARAHGTSSSHQRVSPADILDAPVALPSDALIKHYSIMVNGLLEKIDCNQSQIQTLSETRDTLLPKLISGQVRVYE